MVTSDMVGGVNDRWNNLNVLGSVCLLESSFFLESEFRGK